jgi:hypothetical protein
MAASPHSSHNSYSLLSTAHNSPYLKKIMERMQSAKDITLVDCGTEAKVAGVAAGQTSAEKIFVYSFIE